MTVAPRHFFFVHVMKTGGTTLALHMSRQFEPGERYPNEVSDRRHPKDVEAYVSISALANLSPERTAAIRAYTGHFPFMARDVIPVDLVTLTVLREPIDRSISSLKHFKRLYERYHELSLEAIYDDAFVNRHYVHNHQTKVFAVTAADRPETLASTLTHDQHRAYLAGTSTDVDAGTIDAPDTIAVDEARLASAKARLAEVDVVGVSEEFSDFVELLRRDFGWWPEGLSAQARANVSPESWEASAELRARIARDNRFDLELYEYARELIAERRGEYDRP